MAAKIRLYLDKRHLDRNNQCHLKIAVQSKNDCAYIPTDIHLGIEEWSQGKVVGRNDAALLNRIISTKLFEVEKALWNLRERGQLEQKTNREIVELLKIELDPEYAENVQKRKEDERYNLTGIIPCFERYISGKENLGTKSLYTATANKIKEYCDKNQIEVKSVTLENIRKGWLESFESFCLETERQNTVAIHLRNIRAVFNMAIDDELITNYPFRKFKIKKEESTDKSYSSSELYSLFNYPCYDGGEQEALDMFKMMFCLIGINCVDLAYLEKPYNGRIEYRRRKTHKLYSIRIEPEVYSIISKYSGDKFLLSILERVPNYKTYFNRMGKTLRKIGKERIPGKASVGKALLPDICTGSARTSWATIAQEELDIPREVIAAALGHHTTDVTTTYLRTDWRKKIDEANRKVIDLVFYGKK